MSERFKALSYISRYLKMLEEERPRSRVERVITIHAIVKDFSLRNRQNIPEALDIYHKIENIDILTQFDEYERILLMYGNIDEINKMWIYVFEDMV